MLDRYQWGRVRRISPEAPVPVLELERETTTAGGAANVALNLAALNVKTEIIGKIGDDQDGIEVVKILDSAGIKKGCRDIGAGKATITKTRVIAQGQQICRIDRENQVGHYHLDDKLLREIMAKIHNNDAVIVSDYSKGVVCQNLVNCLVAAKKEKDIFISTDPKPTRYLDLSGFSLITQNKKSFRFGGIVRCRNGLPSIENVCQRIRNKFQPKYLAVTLRGDGIMLICDNFFYHLPTVAKQVVDVCGAGDTVIAILTVALASGMDPTNAAQLANLAARIVVSKTGTATASQEEIVEAIKNSDQYSKDI